MTKRQCDDIISYIIIQLCYYIVIAPVIQYSSYLGIITKKGIPAPTKKQRNYFDGKRMAASEIKEGFLCPLCMQDLGAIPHLLVHFEAEHANEDKAVLQHLKGLFGKAKKKILKKIDDDALPLSTEVSEKSVLLSHSTYLEEMWQPHPLGAGQSHFSEFKKLRSTRLEYYSIETNKLLIRLDKLLSPNAPLEPKKRKAFESEIVSWIDDKLVSLCPGCARSFVITRRKHHCRLCGGVMCNKCSQFLPSSYAKHLMDPSNMNELHESGFHRSGSNSSLNSMFTPEGELHIRTCIDCRQMLERYQHQLQLKSHRVPITVLHERMKQYMDEVEKCIPKFVLIADSLCEGETKYELKSGQELRSKILKLYDLIDAISKRVMQLGSDEQPSKRSIQIQKNLRSHACIFLQENLLGLQSLPTEEQCQAARNKRRIEMQHRIEEEERRVAEERRMNSLQNTKQHHRRQNSDSLSRKSGASHHRRNVSVGNAGWQPEPVVNDNHNSSKDPMIVQMDNIREFIEQAKHAQRYDEVEILEENLRELQKAHIRSTENLSSI